MKFISLEINNWLIYRGTQELIFPQDDHANILLIFGENMHGKTSLLNAVRWALYGEALDRQKKVISNEKLLNIDAASNNENSYSVRLKVLADGKDFEIHRFCEINIDKTKTSLILKEDGRVQDGSESQSKIEALVPKQISQFLLFDGELLNQFEQLVVDEVGPQAIAIKKSIEKALGLPVLQRAFEELSTYQKSASKEFQSEAKQVRNLEVLIRNLEIHENDLASKITEKEQVEKQIDEANSRISELDEILDKASGDIALGEKKKLLSEERARNLDSIKQSDEKLKSLMANLWREPLNASLAPILKTIRDEITKLNEQRRIAEITQSQVAELENALRRGACSQCGSGLESKQISELNEKLHKMQTEILDVQQLNKKIASLENKAAGITVSKATTNILFQVLETSNNKNSLSRRNIAIEDELFEIRNQLADFDEENGRRTKAEYQVRVKEVGRLGEKLITIEGDIEKIETEINYIKKHPDYLVSGKNSNSKQKLDNCENLLKIFKLAIEGYREKMRKKVGERASISFKNLTTEKAFDYLRINQSYGLDLIIDGKQVSRSAGAEQIVALSLIEALNHHGRRKGPMLMDTPAGRLDKSHRENVMNYLPTVVTQLAFFAHSGELTDEDIYFDRSRIGKKYRINRIGSFHSVLEET